MAKDDYYVIVYQILAYLYKCLKEGKPVDGNMIRHDGELFAINERYWEYIMVNMMEQGFVRGIAIKKNAIGDYYISHLDECEITPDGIDYLCDNSRIKRAYEFAKGVLTVLPIKL